MARDALTRSIHQVQEEILTLGSMVEQAMLDVVDALKRRDRQTALRIYDGDRLINEKRFAIENAIIIIMATQQPMAHDLRLLAAMLEVITELERMGDYAKGIARVIVRLEDVVLPTPMREFNQMADTAVSMLHRALGAFVEENSELASEIPAEDDIIDNLYIHVYHSIVNAMIANPSIIDHANLLMWVAHNLERMGDRVTNICERTVFIATGELMEMDSSDEPEEE